MSEKTPKDENKDTKKTKPAKAKGKTPSADVEQLAAKRGPKELSGVAKYFNSTTTDGRANVAKATYGAILLGIVYYKMRKSRSKGCENCQIQENNGHNVSHSGQSNNVSGLSKSVGGHSKSVGGHSKSVSGQSKSAGGHSKSGGGHSNHEGGHSGHGGVHFEQGDGHSAHAHNDKKNVELLKTLPNPEKKSKVTIIEKEPKVKTTNKNVKAKTENLKAKTENLKAKKDQKVKEQKTTVQKEVSHTESESEKFMLSNIRNKIFKDSASSYFFPKTD